MNFEFNMARVANQSERYEDIVSLMREIAKGSPEDVFNDVWNLFRAELKIYFSKIYLKNILKQKGICFFSFNKLQKQKYKWGSLKTSIYHWVGTETGPDVGKGFTSNSYLRGSSIFILYEYKGSIVLSSHLSNI